jgi:hypothetical protein
MKQSDEYRQHAEACRRLLKGARTEQERQQILQIAEAWDQLAEDRERRILPSRNSS